MRAKSAKAKGRRLEQDVVDLLKKAGLQARRQPGSGIYSDFPHDVELNHNDRRYIIECKSRRNGFATLNNWMGQADILVVKVDRGEPIAYLPLSVLRDLIGE